jgi:L-alanine-DL-glutamate epimerase-like enolase superfamily enzyme
MRVVELTAFHVRIPLRKPIRHASHTRTETDNLLVRCVLEDGSEGFGEGVPRDYVTGETIDSALDLLLRSDLGGQMGTCQDMPTAVALAERLALAPVAGDDRKCRGNAARCAVELAFLDACGKKFGEPLSNVTRLVAPDLYQQSPRVRYSGAITSTQGLKLRFAVWKYRIYGFHQLKVKVGIAGQNDVERLHIIRSRGGKKVDLRIDANEAWTPGEASERILELKPFGITAVEQPVPHKDAGCLAEVRKQTGIPIMLDESLCGLVDAERAASAQSCDLFNLRLSKCGGYIPSLRLAEFARRHGLGYQLGCQVGETALLSAAGRHFAASVGDIRYVEGSYDRHLVCEPLGTRDITFGWGGWAPALTGGGLGVDLDRDALERVTVRREPLLG